MSGTVAQTQVSAFTSPSNGDALDATIVKANDNATRTAHNTHDADATIHVQTSLLAARPAASTTGRLWVTSDGLRMYYDTGSAWNELAYLPVAGGTLTGGLTITMAGVSSALTAASVNSAPMLLHSSNVGFTVDSSFDIGSSIASGRPRDLYLARNAAIGGTLSVTGQLTASGALAHAGSTVGFFATSPRSRPTVSGSKTGADALAVQLLSALGDLAGLGLIHDATT